MTKSKIPIYQIKIPEYKFTKVKLNSKKTNFQTTPNYSINIPEVYEKNKPDFERIAQKIEICIKKNFLNKKIVLRMLGSSEHNGKSINELVKIIKKLGHDRYDPNRRGDRYENIDNKHIDFFALNFKVSQNGRYLKHALESFYFWPITDGRGPIRVDIALIYDPSKLKVIKHRYKGRENEIKKDGFVFKNPKNKPDALLGIVKIL